jgi:hypothetical protein
MAQNPQFMILNSSKNSMKTTKKIAAYGDPSAYAWKVRGCE